MQYIVRSRKRSLFDISYQIELKKLLPTLLIILGIL